MAKFLLSSTRRSEVNPPTKPSDKQKKKLNDTFLSIHVLEDPNQSLIEDPVKNAKWAQDVHDTLQYLLENLDDTIQIIENFDKSISELSTKIEQSDKKYEVLNEDYIKIK